MSLPVSDIAALSVLPGADVMGGIGALAVPAVGDAPVSPVPVSFALRLHAPSDSAIASAAASGDSG